MTAATHTPLHTIAAAADPPHAVPRVPAGPPPTTGGLRTLRNALMPVPGMRRLHRTLARSAALVLLRHGVGGTFSWGRCLQAMPRLCTFTMPSKDAADIFHRVFVEDEYGVCHLSLGPEDVVIDIGAHVGSFTALCHLLGSRSIVACEASPRLFSVLRRNLRPLRGTETLHAAVGRGDAVAGGEATISSRGCANDTVLFSGRRFHFPTQSMGPADDGGDRCPWVGIDRILARFPRIRLLKLDCEGSEFPILLTSELLSRVDLIVGEYHEVSTSAYRLLASRAQVAGNDRYRIEQLSERLAARGFGLAVYPVETNLGLFTAWREGPDSP